MIVEPSKADGNTTGYGDAGLARRLAQFLSQLHPLNRILEGLDLESLKLKRRSPNDSSPSIACASVCFLRLFHRAFISEQKRIKKELFQVSLPIFALLSE